jgi:type I restriction enzyme S subunit
LKIGSGATPTGGQAAYLRDRDNWALIRSQNVHDRQFEATGLAFISDDQAASLQGVRLQEGDVLLNITGDGVTFARACQVPASALPAVVNQHVCIIRPDPEKVDAGYVLAYLTHPAVKSYIESFNAGGSRRAITKAAIESFSLPVPDKSQQQAIAEVLGSLDEKITLNRRVNDTLEAMARAIFQSWFIDFDPVRAKTGGESPESICQRLRLTPEQLALFPADFEEAVDGVVPAGWTQSTLGEQAKAHRGFIQTGPFGSQLHASDYVDEGIPVVMPQDMVNRRVSVSKVARVSEDMAQRLSRHALQPGDVVYSRRGDVERHALVSEREAGWLCGTGCLLVRLGAGWPSQAYLSEALDFPATREWLVRHAVGATMPNLNTSILGAVPLLVPPAPLMQAFERIVGPLRRQQIANCLESDTLAETRDALLPKLLSGELRPDETCLGV